MWGFAVRAVITAIKPVAPIMVLAILIGTILVRTHWVSGTTVAIVLIATYLVVLSVSAAIVAFQNRHRELH
jgi:hypothetical protein